MSLYFSNREGCAFCCGAYIKLSSENISLGKKGGTTTLSFYTERTLSLKIDVAFTVAGYEHCTIYFISAVFVVYEEFLMFFIYITAEVLVTFR